jgi:recombination protein RecA
MAKAKAAAPDDPVQALLGGVNQQFGTGALMDMSVSVEVPVEVIPTGCTALDVALGIGGLPRGRVVEIYGPEMSGKTTLALHAIASAQRLARANGTPGVVVMIDAEHALDPDYARALGVDTEHNFLLSQPDTGEQGLEIADMCARSGVVDIIVIDSVAALVPRAEIEGDMGDSHPGLQARLMSQALRKITGSLSKTRTTCIFINQLREKIGVFYGNPEVTTGGKALKFYASVRLDVRKIESLKDGTTAIGQRVRIKVVKNKLAPPFRQAEADIIYGLGFSRAAQLLDLGVEFGIIVKSGAFYSVDGHSLGQGKDKSRAALAVCADEYLDDLERRITERMATTGLGQAPSPPSPVRSAPAVDPAALVPQGSISDLLAPGGAK